MLAQNGVNIRRLKAVVDTARGDVDAAYETIKHITDKGYPEAMATLMTDKVKAFVARADEASAFHCAYASKTYSRDSGKALLSTALADLDKKTQELDEHIVTFRSDSLNDCRKLRRFPLVPVCSPERSSFLCYAN